MQEDPVKLREIYWHRHEVDKALRAGMKHQRPCVVWFTGLSGSGKSTIANRVEVKLAQMGVHTYLLDGDNLRHGLNSDLGFDAQARVENIRRSGEVVRLLVDAGLIVLAAFVSPYRRDREQIREMLEEGEFIETYVDAPLQVCERRDPKGLYQKARLGEIVDFTGIGAPYEAPLSPEIRLRSDHMEVEEAAESVVRYLKRWGYIKGVT